MIKIIDRTKPYRGVYTSGFYKSDTYLLMAVDKENIFTSSTFRGIVVAILNEKESTRRTGYISSDWSKSKFEPVDIEIILYSQDILNK